MKLFSSSLRRLSALAFVLAFAATGLAQSGTTTTGNVYVNATIATSAYVDVDAAAGGLATSSHDPGGDGTTFDFGTLDAYGFGGAPTGVSINRQAGGTLFSTPYKITPHFSGFDSQTASLKIEQSDGNSSEDMAVIREGATAQTVGSVPVSGAGSNFTTTAQSGTAITRYLGIYVANGNGSGNTGASAGARHPVLVVTLTVE